MLEARGVLGRARELQEARVGQGCDEKESGKQTVQQLPAIRDQY